MAGLGDAIEVIYNRMHDPEMLDRVGAFHERHETASLLILTIHDAQPAIEVAEWLRPVIEGRVVVEVGAGVGLLAVEMARHAKQVYAIESDPAWSWAFCEHLYDVKPPNLTWIFGTAESVSDHLTGDVAVFVTRSGRAQMGEVAGQLAVSVIDVTKDGLGDDRDLAEYGSGAGADRRCTGADGSSDNSDSREGT